MEQQSFKNQLNHKHTIEYETNTWLYKWYVCIIERYWKGNKTLTVELHKTNRLTGSKSIQAKDNCKSFEEALTYFNYYKPKWYSL